MTTQGTSGSRSGGGVTPKTLDLLITTYALSHGVALLTTDGNFAAMRRVGVPLQLLRTR